MAYLSLDEFKERSSFEAAEIDEFFARPGRSFARWEKSTRSRKIDDPLRRRYAVPFGTSSAGGEPDAARVPEACKDWLTAFLDARLLRARRYPGAGDEPGDDDLTQEARDADQEIARAADPNEAAHPELPLNAAAAATSGVVKGGPFVRRYDTVGEYWDGVRDRVYSCLPWRRG